MFQISYSGINYFLLWCQSKQHIRTENISQYMYVKFVKYSHNRLFKIIKLQATGCSYKEATEALQRTVAKSIFTAYSLATTHRMYCPYH